MRIGRVAEAVGVSVDAVRLYERMGLVRSERGRNGYRDFEGAAVTILKLVRQAQGLGFSLREIGQVLAGLNGDLSADEVQALLEERIAVVDRQLADLTSLRGLLAARLTEVCALGLGQKRAVVPGKGKRAA
jgi:MerR family copper efflux transcriptional regulator